MAFLLHIDTSVDKGSICLSENERILGYAECLQQKDQSAWLHPAINQLMVDNNLTINDIDVVSVVNGPGSYTGLRIGLAAAKGICYALSKPLITLSTLKVMASDFTKEAATTFICPMIDARRQEVFTAVYDHQLNEVLTPQALILDEHSFLDLLDHQQVLFCGNGAGKWQSICSSPNANFSTKTFDARDAVALAFLSYQNENYADIAYSEPLYLKQVYIKS